MSAQRQTIVLAPPARAARSDRSRSRARDAAFGATLACLAHGAAQAQTLAQATTQSQAPEALSVAPITVASDPANDAMVQAPTRAPLSATQPTSVLGSQYIQNNVAPVSDYAQIVSISPSVFAIEQNGPGNAFSGEVGIRGFQDGQYNVTLDGIPFGDSNNYTHHTSAYFANRDLGEVSVDRGPGTASTIGDATFGGTISLLSKQPASNAALTVYGGGGTFDSSLVGTELDTGTLPGGGKATFDFEHIGSAGALTFAQALRTNVFGKFVQPVGENATLTLVGIYNATDQFFDRGASRQEIAQYGPDFGFTDNPRLQNDYRYNENNSHSDFEYADLNSAFAPHWLIDEKVYTYAYNLKGVRGIDVTNPLPGGTVYGAQDVPGTAQDNQYRAFGDVLTLTRTLGGGNDVRVGGWIEHQANAYTQANIDFTRGGILAPDSFTAFTYLDHEDLLTLQPFFELDLKPARWLTITPGVKYDYFQRSLDAQVNTGGRPLKTASPYGKALPAVTVHAIFAQDWTGYFQYAQGFLAPPLNYIQVPDPSASQVAPQQTNNYQIGTSYQTSRLSISGDLYFIDFSNMVASRAVGVNTIYFNQGAVHYYGIEAEGTYAVGGGLSLYANGSGNVARSEVTDQPIADAPDATAAGGVILVRGGLYASLLDKWVGSRFGDVGLRQGLDPFNDLTAAIAYTLHGHGVPQATLRLQFDNLLDSRKIDAFDLYAGKNATPIFYTQPGRSVFASVDVPL